MTFTNLSDIVPVLVLMDGLIIIVLIVFFWKNRSLNIQEGLQKKIEVFESLLGDVDHMSIYLKKNMAEKYHLLKKLDENIDQKIVQLQSLMEKADKTIFAIENDDRSKPVDKKAFTVLNQQDRILQMVKEGTKMEEIAGCLSIPRETVKLVMDLKKTKIKED